MSNISRFIGNERGDKICHEDDGCPTELAVLKRFWREQQASTLPEEVDNLVELLDEEEVPYEDSLGVALSLTGRTKQYANGKTATLREQVEKLTKELDNVKQVEFPRRVQKVTDALKRKHEKELAALAEQNEKQKDALLYVMRATCLSADDNPDSPIGMLYKRASNAYELPDLASPVLVRIRAEGMRISTEIHECEDVLAPVGNSVWGEAYQQGWIDGTAKYRDVIHARAAELEKSNG